MNSSFMLKNFRNLEEVLLDKGLAGLGDAYVNFLFSLLISKKSGRPMGAKVNNKILAEAVKKAGLRSLLPRRIDRHTLGNAAESLIVFAWLTNKITLNDSLKILSKKDDVVEAFAFLLSEISERFGKVDEQKDR